MILCVDCLRREQRLLAFDEKRTHWPGYLDHFFSPGTTPATPSFLPLPGANVQFILCTQQFRKNRLYFIRRAGISGRPRRFCEGFLWGWPGECEKRTEGVEQGAGGRICLGKPCFSGFFRTSFNCSGAPEGERMRGWRGMAWGR